MTTTAPTGTDTGPATDAPTLTHWVGGAPSEGRGPRFSDVTNPATGRVSGASPARDDRGDGRRRGSGHGGLPGLARRVAGQAHPDPVRVPRAAERPQGGARRDHHRRARQGALRRARRGRARPRGRRVRLRHAAPAQGRVSPRTSRPASTCYSVRQPLGVVGDHQPVQLPGDGADVVLPDRDRGRQHRRAQAEREGPDRGALDGASCGRRPVCPTACSTSCTATRRRSTRCSTHPDVASISFVGSTPIAKYVYETGTAARQARAGARRREEPHGGAARRRPRPRRRPGGQRGLRLGRRALHGDLRRGRRRRDRRRAGRQDRRADAEA